MSVSMNVHVSWRNILGNYMMQPVTQKKTIWMVDKFDIRVKTEKPNASYYSTNNSKIERLMNQPIGLFH